MIFYITENDVSHAVGRAFQAGGVEVRHIREFPEGDGANKTEIFYGILRGSGAAIRHLQYRSKEYYYVDNGYFDAVYMDQNKVKDMGGKYRVVKNGLLEEFKGLPRLVSPRRSLRILALPPSPYSAFMHDTTPEDWLHQWKTRRQANNDWIDVRHKDEKMPLAEQLKTYDAVIAMNSMAVMEAIRLGKAVYTTHGIVRNAEKFETEIPYYSYADMEAFYADKQFTLEEIAEGKWN